MQRKKSVRTGTPYADKGGPYQYSQTYHAWRAAVAHRDEPEMRRLTYAHKKQFGPHTETSDAHR